MRKGQVQINWPPRWSLAWARVLVRAWMEPEPT
jgi:hypothetical protein